MNDLANYVGVSMFNLVISSTAFGYIYGFHDGSETLNMPVILMGVLIPIGSTLVTITSVPDLAFTPYATPDEARMIRFVFSIIHVMFYCSMSMHIVSSVQCGFYVCIRLGKKPDVSSSSLSKPLLSHV